VRVAIVDDSILIRRSLVKLLDGLANVTEIAEAINVPEANRIVTEFKPDIVILDIRMPGGSGFDVLREIRKGPEHVLVIILSKYSSAAFREEAEREGADYFFDKSDEFENVVDTIRNYKT